MSALDRVKSRSLSCDRMSDRVNIQNLKSNELCNLLIQDGAEVWAKQQLLSHYQFLVTVKPNKNPFLSKLSYQVIIYLFAFSGSPPFIKNTLDMLFDSINAKVYLRNGTFSF